MSSSPLLEARGFTAATPDGRTLFKDLDLLLPTGLTALIGRNGCGKSTLLRLLAGRQRPDAGVATLHTTLAYIPQEYRPGPGESVLDLLGCRAPLLALRRIAAGGSDPADFDAVGDDWDLEARLQHELQRLGLPHLDLHQPADRCSGGELTRVLLAGALLRRPGLLLLDEPTNHLDAMARQMLLDQLRTFPGGVLVVSHDRALLDQADRIWKLSELGLKSYCGPWTAYEQAHTAEVDAAERRVAEAGAQLKQRKRQRQAVQERQQRRLSRGRRNRDNANQAKVLLDRAKERSESTTGRLGRDHATRIQDATAQKREAERLLEQIDPVALPVTRVQVPAGKRLVTLCDVRFGYGDKPVIDGVSLDLVGPRRLALCGPNGSGKSTLLKLIAGTLVPNSGSVSRAVPCTLLDQHLGLLDDQHSALENFRRISPGLSDTEYRTRLAVLRLRHDHALRPVGQLSGGQRLKAALACLLLGPEPPPLLLLDEPTNHQDLESIAALEQALHAYSGGLIVVSHDLHFLERIGIDATLDLEGGGFQCRVAFF